VLGADISAAMLASARERLTEAGLRKVTLIEPDAQTHEFEPDRFDVIASRCGVMHSRPPGRAARNKLAKAARGNLLHSPTRNPAIGVIRVRSGLAAGGNRIRTLGPALGTHPCPDRLLSFPCPFPASSPPKGNTLSRPGPSVRIQLPWAEKHAATALGAERRRAPGHENSTKSSSRPRPRHAS
jgi:SAM-dependent methyltransferase